MSGRCCCTPGGILRPRQDVKHHPLRGPQDPPLHYGGPNFKVESTNPIVGSWPSVPCQATRVRHTQKTYQNTKTVPYGIRTHYAGFADRAIPDGKEPINAIVRYNG